MEERCRGPVARNQTDCEIIVSFRGNQMPISRNANLTFEIKFPQKCGDAVLGRYIIWHKEFSCRPEWSEQFTSSEYKSRDPGRLMWNESKSLEMNQSSVYSRVSNAFCFANHSWWYSFVHKCSVQIHDTNTDTVTDSLCLANCYRWESSIHWLCDCAQMDRSPSATKARISRRANSSCHWQSGR